MDSGNWDVGWAVGYAEAERAQTVGFGEGWLAAGGQGNHEGDGRGV